MICTPHPCECTLLPPPPKHTHTPAKQVSGKPIKFVGVGEKMDALEPFYPERMAQRILGMGDMLTLYEKAQEAIKVCVCCRFGGGLQGVGACAQTLEKAQEAIEMGVRVGVFISIGA